MLKMMSDVMAIVERLVESLKWKKLRLTRCLVEACKEVSCFAPLALAAFIGHRIFCYSRSGHYLSSLRFHLTA